MNKDRLLILKGNLLFTPSSDQFVVHKEAFLICADGVIQEIAERLPEQYADCHVIDHGDALIIPGFVDLHTHAAQFNQRGLGLDLQLLEWLKKYTFKEESRFADREYAREVYEKFADELIRQGTTRAAVFATIHKESTQILFDIFSEKGMGGYVGKVNMDAHCPAALREDTGVSLRETEELIEAWKGHPLVKPIITPRFAITSTKELLTGLGSMALKYDLPVQSHLSENMDEVNTISRLFPEQQAYYRVYNEYQLFGQTPTLMAHCIYLQEDAIQCMQKQGVVAVHCPDSNLNLASGVMQARKLLEAGIQVGLGTDVGAGHDLSIRGTIVRSIQMSKLLYTMNPEYKPLTLAEAFYMGTKGGGAFFGKVGSLEPGYACDALVIDDSAERVEGHTLLERLQRFIYGGNPSSIRERYVAGKKIG